MVPACPQWTVKDVVAHLTGIASDMTKGNVAGAGQDEWTAAQIEARRNASVEEILEEWEAAAGQVEPALAYIHPAAAAGTVGDAITHEHDLRAALHKPGARDTEGVSIALDSYVRSFGRRIRQAGLPTLNVKTGSAVLRAGKEEPQGSVSGEPFELLRALTGRRTREEVSDLEWSVDPNPYIDIFSAYSFPEAPLRE